MSSETQMSGHSQRFDAFYFSHCCGRPYQRDEYWLSFFGDIADQIISQINPRTVLDAGCAMGFLVEALRLRGVEASGFDVSEFAIRNVHPSVRSYCEVRSIIERFSGEFDLIVCIEVLEHLPPEEAHAAVANLCVHTNDILFSSIPDDYREATHLNVQPSEYWASLFAQHGFFRDTEQEPFVTPWSRRFRKVNEPFARTVAGYERRLWRLEQEARARREVAIEQQDALARLSDDHDEALTWLTEAFFRASASSQNRLVAWRMLRSRPDRRSSANVPLSAAPVGDVVHLRRGRHSLWCFRSPKGAIQFDAELGPGTYIFRGRALAVGDTNLEVRFDEREYRVVTRVVGSISDFSVDIGLQERAQAFRLKFGGSDGICALGDFHVLRAAD